MVHRCINDGNDVLLRGITALASNFPMAAVSCLKYLLRTTFPESLYYWPPAPPSRDNTSRSASSPSGQAFLTICHAPPAVVAGHADMAASESSVLGRAQGKGGESANNGIRVRLFSIEPGTGLLRRGRQRRAG